MIGIDRQSGMNMIMTYYQLSGILCINKIIVAHKIVKLIYLQLSYIFIRHSRYFLFNGDPAQCSCMDKDQNRMPHYYIAISKP